MQSSIHSLNPNLNALSETLLKFDHEGPGLWCGHQLLVVQPHQQCAHPAAQLHLCPPLQGNAQVLQQLLGTLKRQQQQRLLQVGSLQEQQHLGSSVCDRKS